jgi:hypothetical protein
MSGFFLAFSSQHFAHTEQKIPTTGRQSRFVFCLVHEFVLPLRKICGPGKTASATITAKKKKWA